jgi:hypothetical protein
MPTTIPTQQQVEAVVAELARSIGDVNVRVSEVMLMIDTRFPGLPDEDFDAVRRQAVVAVDAAVSVGMHRLWG